MSAFSSLAAPTSSDRPRKKQEDAIHKPVYGPCYEGSQFPPKPEDEEDGDQEEHVERLRGTGAEPHSDQTKDDRKQHRVTERPHLTQCTPA